MKNLKIAVWIGAGLVSGTVFYFRNRRIKQEEREHKLILDQLKSNKDIVKVEDPEKTVIRFLKHPKSKKYDDKNFQWKVQINNAMIIPVKKNNFIIPSNAEKQFHYYFHERGHLKNKDNGHFKKETACGYNPDDCLQRELEAELNVIEASKKIGKKFEETHWPTNLFNIQEQCKKCLKIINKGKCPKNELEKIEKHLDIISQAFKIESRAIIFGGRKNG